VAPEEPDALADPTWPFDQGPRVAAITVRTVLDGHPILHVSHDADDHGWQFLDGRAPEEADARLISMSHALSLDPSLREVGDLPPGWVADREGPSEPWRRRPSR
jgi:hypothetical protein